MPEQQITLRRIHDSDAIALYRWQQDPGTHAFDPVNASPSFDKHLAWFVGRWATEHTRWFIAELHGQPIGTAYVDAHEDKIWLSVVIAPELRGRGLGSALVRLASVTLLRQGEPMLWARIHQGNEASLWAFTGAGYKLDRQEGVWTFHYLTAGGAARPGAPTK